MVIYKGRAITLKHFLLSPVIAAGARYDFNIGDVISFQVNGWLKLIVKLKIYQKRFSIF